MRILLLFLAFLTLSCSQEDPVEPEPELVKPEFSIFIMDECPNGSGLDSYAYVDQETFEEHLFYAREQNQECIYLTVVDYAGREHKGYLGGLTYPPSYDLPPM